MVALFLLPVDFKFFSSPCERFLQLAHAVTFFASRDSIIKMNAFPSECIHFDIPSAC